MTSPTVGDIDGLRLQMTTATQRLLGDTISVPDALWRGDSRLPGWTRGHVATHVARQADALSRLVEGARTGRPGAMYPGPGQREAEIAAGADRSGLDLQVDLDTSAGALASQFDAAEVHDLWDVGVELRGGVTARVRQLPLARLCEVALHHVDLDIGFELDDVDPQSADSLLEWLVFRLSQRADFPRLRLLTGPGAGILVGTEGNVAEVGGTSVHLLGWLTGRGGSEHLNGTEGVTLPAF